MKFIHIPEQPDHVAARPIAWTLVVTVVAILACALVVWLLRDARTTGGGGVPATTVDSVPPSAPFSTPGPSEATRAAQRAALDAWQWADRTRAIVRVPVDVAIDRYLERAR